MCADCTTDLSTLPTSSLDAIEPSLYLLTPEISATIDSILSIRLMY